MDIKDLLRLLIANGVISAMISGLITQCNENRRNRESNLSNKKLQVDKFARSISGQEMINVFENWLSLLYDINDAKYKKKIGDVNQLNNMLKKTVLYASSETIRRVSNFQYFNYVNNGVGDPIETVVLVAGIILALKKDFSDEEISIEDFLKIKVSDFDSQREQVISYKKKYGY